MSASSHYMRLIEFGHVVLQCPYVAANFMLYPRPEPVAGHRPDVAFHDGTRILAVGLVLSSERLRDATVDQALHDYLAAGMIVAVAGLDLAAYQALCRTLKGRGLAIERLLYVEPADRIEVVSTSGKEPVE